MAELKGTLYMENELQGTIDAEAVLEGKLDAAAELKAKLETPAELHGKLEQKNVIKVQIIGSGPRGRNGISPVVEVTDIEGGHRVTFTDVNGEQSFDVLNGKGGGGSGTDGKDGEDGATFIPHVSETGELSWTNDKGLENPETVNIKGKDGRDGVDGYSPVKGKDYWTDYDQQEIMDMAVDTIEQQTPEILQKAIAYTDSKIAEMPTPDVSGQINAHNTNTEAHNDIRLVLQSLITKVNDLLDSDDTTLDQMSEIVAYIKDNRGLIESVTTTKVNVSDIIDNLTTNIPNKPLSAKQGMMLKTLIDAIKIPTKISEFENDEGYLKEHQSLEEYSKTTDMLKMVYPVGAVYISVVATPPQVLFGFGIWEQIKDRFLLSAGDTYKAGNTGGSVTHSHKYKTGVRVYYGMVAGADANAHMAYDYVQAKWIPAVKDDGQSSLPVKANGSVTTNTKEVSPYFMASEAQVETKNNMPPYLAIYVWKRTA